MISMEMGETGETGKSAAPLTVMQSPGLRSCPLRAICHKSINSAG